MLRKMLPAHLSFADTFTCLPRLSSTTASHPTHTAPAPGYKFLDVTSPSHSDQRADAYIISKLPFVWWKQQKRETNVSLVQMLARERLLKVQHSDGTLISVRRLSAHRLVPGDKVLVHNKLLGNGLIDLGGPAGTVTWKRRRTTMSDAVAAPWVASCVRFSNDDIVIISKPAGVCVQVIGN
jgi:hypothetical protein